MITSHHPWGVSLYLLEFMTRGTLHLFTISILMNSAKACDGVEGRTIKSVYSRARILNPGTNPHPLPFRSGLNYSPGCVTLFYHLGSHNYACQRSHNFTGNLENFHWEVDSHWPALLPFIGHLLVLTRDWSCPGQAKVRIQKVGKEEKEYP